MFADLRRVFALTDWYRDGTLAEFVAVEGRNLAPLPGDVDFTVGARADLGPDRVVGTVRARPPSGGAGVLVHGAAGSVGSMATQLAIAYAISLISRAISVDTEITEGVAGVVAG